MSQLRFTVTANCPVQAYRVGQKVKGRIIGARPLDGLSVLSLKPTVVEQQVASISEVKPGSLMTGTITSIADYGMLVALAPGIRCTCCSNTACFYHCCACALVQLYRPIRLLDRPVELLVCTL